MATEGEMCPLSAGRVLTHGRGSALGKGGGGEGKKIPRPGTPSGTSAEPACGFTPKPTWEPCLVSKCYELERALTGMEETHFLKTVEFSNFWLKWHLGRQWAKLLWKLNFKFQRHTWLPLCKFQPMVVPETKCGAFKIGPSLGYKVSVRPLASLSLFYSELFSTHLLTSSPHAHKHCSIITNR